MLPRVRGFLRLSASRSTQGYMESVAQEHKPAGKREELELPNETRYIRRDDEGHFTSDQVDKGESLSRDRQRDAKHDHGPGQGDRGDNHSSQ